MQQQPVLSRLKPPTGLPMSDLFRVSSDNQSAIDRGREKTGF